MNDSGEIASVVLIPEDDPVPLNGWSGRAYFLVKASFGTEELSQLRTLLCDLILLLGLARSLLLLNVSGRELRLY